MIPRSGIGFTGSWNLSRPFVFYGARALTEGNAIIQGALMTRFLPPCHARTAAAALAIATVIAALTAAILTAHVQTANADPAASGDPIPPCPTSTSPIPTSTSPDPTPTSPAPTTTSPAPTPTWPDPTSVSPVLPSPSVPTTEP